MKNVFYIRTLIINTSGEDELDMRRKKELFYILFCFCLVLLALYLNLDPTFWLVLGYLTFSLIIMFSLRRERKSFKTIHPFPALSRLGEEQIKTMYCLFLESVPHGIFHEVLEETGMETMLKTAHKKLNEYFGKKHVCRISQNQFVIIKEFDLETVRSYEDRHTYLERLSAYISYMLTSLIPPANTTTLWVTPLTVGSASSGIRYRAQCSDDLIELAYFTMKVAQAEKRRFLVSDETIRAWKLNNEECMEGFLKKDWESEFTPFFQPIIDSKTFKVIGMESLARWQLGRIRILDAKIFKDLAHEMGCIGRIDMLMIEKTFKVANKLHQEGLVQPHFKIVINISALTLQTLSAQEFVGMAGKYGINSEDIELDIKDTVLSNPWLNKNLKEFKKHSIKVALDIFDRQAFDLESLFYNQYDTIKLDYSRDTNSEEDVPVYDTRLYPSLVSIASEYGVEILAKGIENQVQMIAAINHKVRYLQGNYFTLPVPFSTFRMFVKKYQHGLYQKEYNFA